MILIRKTFGSRPQLCKVLWVDHTNGTVGGVFEDLYGVRFCEAVARDELEGERKGERLAGRDLLTVLEARATVVIREPNV